MDADGNGVLSENEIRALLQCDAFECSYEDVEDVTGPVTLIVFGNALGL